jgi:LysM repeat protein
VQSVGDIFKKTQMFARFKTRVIILLALITVLFPLYKVSRAQSETPYDLIDAVNDLRALNGLEPYQIDPWLMAYAQEHSDYQASMKSGTHLHSDGKLPWEIGLQENVASGDEGIITVAVVVYEIWVDWGHRHVLTGYTQAEIGAGMAIGDNGQIYYTVDIRPAQGAPTVVPELGTTVPFRPYSTSTPNPDGAIYHVVGPGQALWSIAISYGVKVDDIRRLNGIPADSNIVQVGQKLLIRTASPVTPAPTETTSPIATRMVAKPTLTVTKTKNPTVTAVPSPTLTPVPSITADGLSLKDKRLVGEVGLVIAGIGFVIVIYFGFRRRDNNSL